jgi:hypothetical protein
VSLRRLHQERTTACSNCKTALNSINELNNQRSMDEDEAKKHSDPNAAGPKNFRTSIEKLKQKRRSANYQADGDTNLATNEETAEEMKLLAQKKRQQDAALDQLGSVLGQIQHNAKLIHAELEKQNAILDKQTSTVEDLTQRIGKLTKDIKGFIEETKPLTCAMWVIGCLLILSIVGFFLFEFGAI